MSCCSVEYKLHEASLATPEEKVETYHRIAEALKFGNMLKPHMSDPAFSKAQVSWHGAWGQPQTPTARTAASTLLLGTEGAGKSISRFLFLKRAFS